MHPTSPMFDSNWNSNAANGSFVEASPENPTIDPNVLAVQQMHACEPLGWRGGERFFEGSHDEFCFVCGSTKELFGCQTCENCYHASCMTPSLEMNEVPVFWFCPHCVRTQRHIPPQEENFFSPLPTSLPVYHSSKTPSTVPPPNTTLIMETGIAGLDKLREPSNVYPQRKEDPPNITQQPTPPSIEAPNLLKSKSRTEEPVDTTPRKLGRPRRGSPPRKKSKYSAFSKEVDKALSVIYSELEIAAGYGKSEDDLESKVQALEQQLKMQEGQMLLSTRELEFVRKELAKQREESALMKVDSSELRKENASLKDEIQRKEAELNDWRLKLRSMIGSEFE